MVFVHPVQTCQSNFKPESCLLLLLLLFCQRINYLFYRAFREVCHYIGNSVEEKYKRAKCVTVGAFVFLRFFNPAIVSPDSENLCKPIENNNIRRALLLITKVIQNLANNVLFGAKEPYMIVLNDFLNDNIVKVTTFLEEISVSAALTLIVY